MSVQVRRRRESATFLSSFVGAQAELLVDTTNNRVQVHDGTTPGGWPAARLDEVALAPKFTSVSDASYTILPGDSVVALVTALTAPRTLTLPSAASVKPGKTLRVTDQAGGLSSTNTLSIAAAGTDRINGATAGVFVAPFADVSIVSDGVSKWTYDVQGIARGGTGATSANAALVALGAVGRTAVANANYTAQAADRTIAFTSLAAARTVTLPAASAFPTGTQLLVVDESGACSAVNAITVAAAGSDTINGLAAVVLAAPYGYVALQSNGAARWTIVDQALPPSMGVTPTAGRYLRACMAGGQAATTFSYPADRIDLYPYLPGFDVAADRIGLNVTTGAAGALAKVLVYASDAQGRPDRLIVETGTLDCSAAAAVEISVTLGLRKGAQYWLGTRCSAAVTLSSFASNTTPDLDLAAIATIANKTLRRTLAFATAAPTAWGYAASEVSGASATAIFFRST